MKHAYLIIAHNNWWQLKNLIALLDSPNHDIYIHIDKKSKGFEREDFRNITQYSKVSIDQEIKVYWGGYSQVEVELLLLDKACAVGYDYYHLLSGADMPLRNNDEIDAFFEHNNGLEFIDYDEEKLQTDPEIKRRTRLYHFLQNYRRGFKAAILNQLFTFFERVLLVMQLVIGVNRVKKEDWVIKYGSNWFSITDQLAKKVLSEQKKIRQVFRFTNSADELFVQTIAYNCGFKDRIYRLAPKGVLNNMRYIDWSRGKNGNPYTFTVADYELLVEKKALFARKFSETIDKQVIEKISALL